MIGGATRDEKQVMDIGFTVFSMGANCQDVRKRATTESFNKRIKINNVNVFPGDLVFADSEGIIVIPKNIESTVIDQVIKRDTLKIRYYLISLTEWMWIALQKNMDFSELWLWDDKKRGIYSPSIF